MKNSSPLGKRGEEIACNFLQDLGYKIITVGWNCRYGEIDIIAHDKNELVLVEVKTRTSHRFGSPEAAVTKQKMQRILNSAYIYLQTIKPRRFRLDVVSIMLKQGQKCEIKHLKNVSPNNL
ncbi:MAG: YraN family protein [bacterium]